MPRALLDTNVLVHAVYRRSPLHANAAALVARGLRERGLFCLAPQNLIEFAAVVTRDRFVNPPLPPEEVFRITDILYRSRRLGKIYPKRGTVRHALRDGRHLETAGPAWYDLFLAATMKDAGVHMIVTENKRDFSRISGLTVLSPNEALSTFVA